MQDKNIDSSNKSQRIMSLIMRAIIKFIKNSLAHQCLTLRI